MLPNIYCACHQETKKVVLTVLTCLESALLSLHGLNLKDYVAFAVWDGDAGTVAAFKEFFGAPFMVRLCLQHAKRQAKKRFNGGYQKYVPLVLEVLAFCPQPVFHLGAEALLSKLRTCTNQQKGVAYLTTNGQGGAFVPVGGEWDAPYRSDFTIVPPGKSTYLAQCPESMWRVDVWSHEIFNDFVTVRKSAKAMRYVGSR